MSRFDRIIIRTLSMVYTLYIVQKVYILFKCLLHLSRWFISVQHCTVMWWMRWRRTLFLCWTKLMLLQWNYWRHGNRISRRNIHCFGLCVLRLVRQMFVPLVLILDLVSMIVTTLCMLYINMLWVFLCNWMPFQFHYMIRNKHGQIYEGRSYIKYRLQTEFQKVIPLSVVTPYKQSLIYY